jgi:hypothetical protein
VTQGGRGACVCRGHAGGDDQLAQRCCVVVQQGGVEVWAVAATINNSDVATGGGSPKVVGAPLL